MSKCGYCKKKINVWNTNSWDTYMGSRTKLHIKCMDEIEK